MISVKIPDGRILQFPDGTDQATMKQAIDSLMMKERIDAAKAGTLQLQPGSAERAAAMNAKAMKDIYPEPTLAQRALELAVGYGAGATRGAAGLIGLPGTAMDLINAGMEKVGILDQKATPSPFSGAAIQSALNDLTEGYANYRAPGFAGDVAGTVGEFAGGGLGRRAAILAGLGSEGLGTAAEGTPFENAARFAGAVIPTVLTGRPGAFPKADETARMANVMREAGIDLSTGQGLGSQMLMRMEGRLQPTQQQLADTTAATMRRFGSAEKVATPENLAAVERTLVEQMDNAVQGAAIIPNATQAANAIDVATNYVARVPAGQLTPRVRGIANEIKALAASGKDVPLSRLKTWRSDIGALTVSPDAATREAAHAMRKLLDDMTDTALTAAGRQSDIAALGKAREAYRDFIGVRDAASRAGAEAGILSPTVLNQSMIRAQGREAYATGRTTPMTDFTRSAAATLRPAPAVLPGGQRTISEALPIALATLAAGGSYTAGLGPLVTGLAAAGGAMVPAVSQLAMLSRPVQALLRNPAGALAQASRVAPGLLAQMNTPEGRR
jgi:hypothetical protein